MKYTQFNKIRDYIKTSNLTHIEDRVYNLKAKKTPTDHYVILTNEPLSFGDVKNLDLMKVEIYGVSKGPDIVGKTADEVLELLQSNGLEFDGFQTYGIICTGQTPILTIEGKYKITMFFQIRYLK